MIRIINEKVDYTPEEIRKANRLLSQIADVIENAFDNYSTTWKYKPQNLSLKDINGDEFVQPFKLDIQIRNMLFSFDVVIDNPIAKSFIKPKITFEFEGSESVTAEFRIQDAQELLKATKIAERLKKEISQILSKFDD